MEDKIFEQLQTALPEVQKNVLLKEYCTFRIGGPAEYFFVAYSIEEVQQAVNVAKTLGLPVFAFGGGSNLLFADAGVKGLVVKVNNRADIIIDGQILSATAGMGMNEVVTASLEHSLAGLEWAGGLPGSFGGAIRGNAGCFGSEMKDVILEVTALAENFELKTFTNTECKFSYRNSIFKEKNWVVVSAKVQLKHGNREELQKIADGHANLRKDRHPLEYPNAGSMFKNVDVKQFTLELQQTLAHVVKNDPFPIVPTAYLIFEAGLRGKRIGNAQVSEKHTAFMVNLGDAKAQDVLDLISFVQKEIKQKYGVDLEPEVQYVK